MKTTIGNLSNERLEDQIARIYQEGHRVAPGVHVQEIGMLADLWSEFDDRFAAGTIDRDSDYTPKEAWEDE